MKTYTFEKAYKKMPYYLLGNFDSQVHTTVEDLAWITQIELDLYYEGQPDTDIKTKAQARVAHNWLARLGTKYGEAR
jgi:hypothetical protein